MRCLSFIALRPCFGVLMWIFMLLILSTPYRVAGQVAEATFQIPWKNIAQKDGLPTSRVDRIVLDSKGYCWLGTELGVCRYNGIEMEYFTRKEGLAANQVFQIHEDAMGRIWFLSFKAAPSYMEDGEIRIFDQWERNIDDYAVRIYNASDGGIWLVSNQEYLKVGADLEVEWIKKKGEPQAFALSDPPGGPKVTLFTRYVEIEQDGNLTRLEMNYTSKFFGSYLYQQDHGEYWVFHLEGPSYRISTDSLSIREYPPFPEIRTGREQGWEPNLAGLVPVIVQGGFRLVPEEWNWLTLNIREFLLRNGLSNIKKDQKGNLWVATRNQGVFAFSRQALRAVSIPDQSLFPGKQVEAIASDSSGRIWVGFANAQLAILDQGNIEPLRVVTRDGLANTCYQLLCLPSGIIVGGFDRGLALIREDLRYWNIRIDNNKALVVDQKGRLMKSGGLRLYRFGRMEEMQIPLRQTDGIILDPPDPNLHLDELLDSLEIGPTCMAYSPDGSLWLGTPQGLYHKVGEELDFLGDHIPELQTEIRSLTLDVNGKLWAGTYGNGLIGVDGEEVTVLGKEDGLISDFCYQVIGDGDALWLGTNRGLQQLRITDTGPQIERTLNERDGLPSNEVKAILRKDSILFTGGPEGLCTINIHSLSSIDRKIPVYIERVEVAGKIYVAPDSLQLEGKPGSISISFQGIDYFGAEEMEYRYRLHPEEEDWRITRQRTVNYTHLAPGEYRFEVEAISEGRTLNEKEAQLWFYIAPAWHQTWWARGLGIVLGLLILFLAGLIVFRIMSRRANLKRQLIEMEQKALRAQMNPHFIFNAMNVIQGFIAQKDTLHANEYLAILGQLIRATLRQSLNGWIRLSEELAFIELYLKFEMARFPDEFDYELAVDEELKNMDPYIPSMLFQPFIENSIRHGFQLRDRQGSIRVEVNLEGELVHASIEDNGIGREVAGRMKGKAERERPSMGIFNTEKRLRLLAKDLKKPIGCKIRDGHLPGGRGTRVELTFLYKQDLS